MILVRRVGKSSVRVLPWMLRTNRLMNQAREYWYMGSMPVWDGKGKR